MAAPFARLTKFGPELVGLAALAMVVLLQLADSATLERVRLQVFDLYQEAAPRVDAAGNQVAVVDIDEESIARLGQWPWPRTELAELTRRLGEAGAAGGGRGRRTATIEFNSPAPGNRVLRTPVLPRFTGRFKTLPSLRPRRQNRRETPRLN